jgi:hypothetical protein
MKRTIIHRDWMAPYIRSRRFTLSPAARENIGNLLVLVLACVFFYVACCFVSVLQEPAPRFVDEPASTEPRPHARPHPASSPINQEQEDEWLERRASGY